MQFTEALSSSALWWRVLQAFFSRFVYKLKQKEVKYGDRGAKTFGPKAYVGAQPVCVVYAGAPSCWKTQSGFLVVVLIHGRTFVSKTSL